MIDIPPNLLYKVDKEFGAKTSILRFRLIVELELRQVFELEVLQYQGKPEGIGEKGE